MVISFGICSHNEGAYIGSVLDKLQRFVDSQRGMGVDYEIVVVDDNSDDPTTLFLLSEYEQKFNVRVVKHALNHDFATHKNFMTAQCEGDWIINLDADEWMPESLLDLAPVIIQSNPQVEAYWVPRVNTVDGLTLKHLQQWGWVLTKMPEFTKVKFMSPQSEEYKLLEAFNYIIHYDNGWTTYYEPIVMWPDVQMRIYKNASHIQWEGKVHERLTGFEHFGTLPDTLDFAIRHHKDIKRQEQQNTLYSTITR